MSTLLDILTSINNFHSSHGYLPDTLHLTTSQIVAIIEETEGFPNGHGQFPVSIYGCRIVHSDTFCVAGTQPNTLIK